MTNDMPAKGVFQRIESNLPQYGGFDGGVFQSDFDLDKVQIALALQAKIDSGECVVMPAEKDMNKILAIYQKEEDYNVKTFMDVEELDPYKTLFIWKAFNEYFCKYMLKACGCDEAEEAQFKYAVDMLSKNVKPAPQVEAQEGEK